MSSLRQILSFSTSTPSQSYHKNRNLQSSKKDSENSTTSRKSRSGVPTAVISTTGDTSLDDYIVFEQKPTTFISRTGDDPDQQQNYESEFTLPPIKLPHQKLNSAAMAAVTAQAQHDHKVCVFDVNSGDIHISNNRDVDRNRLISKLHQQMQSNESLKKQFAQVASQLTLVRRKELANESLTRFHQNKQKAMLSRKVLPDNVSRHRANILKHLEIDRCFGDLSKDTSELSSVRISSAAVDALIYHEAQKVADAQLKQQRALILPEGARPVDVLEMRLDAWRRQNVPFAPRTLVQ
jgi:hypothetical protein